MNRQAYMVCSSLGNAFPMMLAFQRRMGLFTLNSVFPNGGSIRESCRQYQLLMSVNSQIKTIVQSVGTRLLRRISQSSSVVRFHLPWQPTCLLQKKNVSWLCKLKLIIVHALYISFDTNTNPNVHKMKVPYSEPNSFFLFFFGEGNLI